MVVEEVEIQPTQKQIEDECNHSLYQSRQRRIHKAARDRRRIRVYITLEVLVLLGALFFVISPYL